MGIAVVVAGTALYAAWPRSTVRVPSAVTGKRYAVRDTAGASEVADRLAAMELRVRNFLTKAEAYAPGDRRLANIRRRWDGSLSEAEADRHVAYSVGKGSISVCVRRADGSMEPENTTMFVLLHELAHVATDSWGHLPEFWDNMRFLLEVAEAVGAYTYQNFDRRESSFCGTAITTSPLTCVKERHCESQLGSKRSKM